MRQILSLVMLVGLAGGSALVGCDRTVADKESVKVKDDGTVVKDKQQVTEKADGTVVKEESHSVNH